MAFTLADIIAEREGAQADLDSAWEAYDNGDAPDRGDIDYAWSKVETATMWLDRFFGPGLRLRLGRLPLVKK